MNYAQRFEQLSLRYFREVGQVASQSASPDWFGFITWLLSLRDSLKPASWRQYRAAVADALLNSDAPELDALLAMLRQPRTDMDQERATLPARTSSSKSKTLSAEDILTLAGYLHERSEKWGRLTVRWLAYGMLIGLRPIEWWWVRAEVVEERIVLYVRNAKHNELRAHGVGRQVNLNLEPDVRRDFLDFLHELQSHDYEKSYQGCRLALWRAARILWPRRKKQPTLYTARHQFAADAKSSGLTPEEIAALMGHAIVDTHREHYGKRRCGRGAVCVEADEGDVQRVVTRMQLKRGAEAGGTSFAVR